MPATVRVIPEITGGVAYVGVGSGADIEGGGATDSVEELNLRSGQSLRISHAT